MGNPIIGIYIPKSCGPHFHQENRRICWCLHCLGFRVHYPIPSSRKNMLPMKMAFVVAYPYFHTHYHQDPVHQRITLVGRFDGNSLAYVFLQPCLTVHWLLGLVLTLELASFHSTGQTANQQSSLFIVDS